MKSECAYTYNTRVLVTIISNSTGSFCAAGEIYKWNKIDVIIIINECAF